MRVTILGASRFGAALAERLIDAEHEVVLIDRDRARLDKLSERLDCGMLEGDGTMPTVLREVFRNEDDVFIAVTNASEDNILAALVARSVGFGRVIPQITSAELLDICEELQLTDVINPHATMADSICAGLEGETAVDHETVLKHDLAIKVLPVPSDFKTCTLADIELPDNVRAVALIRDESERLIEPEMSIEPGDCIVFAADRDALEALADAF